MRVLARHSILAPLALAVGVAGLSPAQQVIQVNRDIATSTTWTANNVYSLQRQIYVLPGATLTIEAGTVVASTTNLGGSLAVAKGAQIFVQGTAQDPVIMTSQADRATWTNGDPRTGTWRESANEWGNLTIMGDAYISENATPGNTPVPSASNVAAMEGLVASFPGDPKVLYGGGNDDDDSGSISHLSIRYGGKVISLNNELNGLSLGGIGRETDIDHVEIMNNVDDGIEIWGGTVGLKYVSIWNIGDDSFDIDQGWRGKAQFVLVVQGHSLDASQGSGVGDNGFEMDGAEDSDWQPVTTATIYNATFIGQPFDGDGATAWRDNARVQFRNCIFMDCGEQVVRFDNVDGDGANGYGHNGTLSWAQTWTTDWSVRSTVNAPANPGAFYRVQTSGKLAEIVDSVFYNNTAGNAYTEATARGVFAAGNNNVLNPTSSPITALSRGPAVQKGGKVIAPVTFLDPRPANDALTSAGFAPADGFFSSAAFRGAFAPGANWLYGWTASSAYGFTPNGGWGDLGSASSGSAGEPVLSGSGSLSARSRTTLSLTNAAPNAPVGLLVSAAVANTPYFGSVIVPDLALGFTAGFATNGSGEASLSFPWPNLPSGTDLYFQCAVGEFPTAGANLLPFSNGVWAETQ